MNEHRIWPLPYSGLPAILNSVAFVLLTFALIAIVSHSETYFLVFFLTGIAMNLVASGKRVVIRNEYIMLEYGFPKPVLRYVVRDVVEIFDINELSRGRLVKYFKALLLSFILVMILPLAYVVVKGAYPNPAYLPLMVIPVIMGVLLLMYLIFTASSYRRFLVKASIATAVVSAYVVSIAVGFLYRDFYGRSVFSDPTAVAVWLVSVLLFAVLAIAITFFAGRNHIVILVDTRGRYYAVGTASTEIAREFMSMVFNVMRESRKGSRDDDDA
ncbi:MAG: hypothetical protein GXO43_06735 [Crenarchaeota archaeon]|nr:hypothetical protein [Thermoproteota archaeon]